MVTSYSQIVPSLPTITTERFRSEKYIAWAGQAVASVVLKYARARPTMPQFKKKDNNFVLHLYSKPRHKRSLQD